MPSKLEVLFGLIVLSEDVVFKDLI